MRCENRWSCSDLVSQGLCGSTSSINVESASAQDRVRLLDKWTSEQSAVQGFVGVEDNKPTQEGVAELSRHQHTILNWLNPTNYDLQQNAFTMMGEPGTGQWLLDSPKFKTWVETNKQTLFC